MKNPFPGPASRYLQTQKKPFPAFSSIKERYMMTASKAQIPTALPCHAMIYIIKPMNDAGWEMKNKAPLKPKNRSYFFRLFPVPMTALGSANSGYPPRYAYSAQSTASLVSNLILDYPDTRCLQPDLAATAVALLVPPQDSTHARRFLESLKSSCRLLQRTCSHHWVFVRARVVMGPQA